MDDIPVALPDKPVRFMDKLRVFMRAKRLAYRTEKTYCLWIVDFIRYHNKRHPETMGRELGDIQFAKSGRGQRLPTVFSHAEAMQVRCGARMTET